MYTHLDRWCKHWLKCIWKLHGYPTLPLPQCIWKLDCYPTLPLPQCRSLRFRDLTGLSFRSLGTPHVVADWIRTRLARDQLIIHCRWQSHRRNSEPEFSVIHQQFLILKELRYKTLFIYTDLLYACTKNPKRNLSSICIDVVFKVSFLCVRTKNEQANSENCGPQQGNKFDLECQRPRPRHGSNLKGLSEGSCIPNINALSLILQKISVRLKFLWQTGGQTDGRMSCNIPRFHKSVGTTMRIQPLSSRERM